MLKIVLIFFIVFVVPKEVLAKEIKTPSGVYSGSVRGGVPRGEGVMKFNNLDIYEGEWRGWKPHGLGKWTKSHGGYSEGEWKKGKFHGPGVIVTSLGKRTVGNWSDGAQDGPAAVHLPNGDQYEGIWERGMLIGHVSYVFANGDEYHGPLENDMPSGVGNLDKTDGDQYFGSMSNGKPYGYGEYEDFQTKTEFKGIFKDGEKHGSGFLLERDGSAWEGFWVGDKATGVGTHTDANGETYSGLYGELKPVVIASTSIVATKSSKDVVPICSEYAFDLVVVKDSAWNELNFSKKSGTSYCIE